MLNKKSLILVSLATLVIASCAFSFGDIDIDPYIVNGQPASRGQFPFYALLKIVLTDGRKAACGGTLINNQWILTAGHCVSMKDVTIEHFEVHLGALNATDLSEEGRIVATSNQSFPHPEFSLATVQNDVALLKLDEPVQFSETVKAINLTEKSSLEPGTRVTAIGFGKLHTSSTTISPTLQFAELALITRRQCSFIFPFLFSREDVICARGTNKESTCNGDSGGPLVLYENDEPTLVGSTSFGFAFGCHYGIPAGFSNTHIFADWIQQTVANN